MESGLKLQDDAATAAHAEHETRRRPDGTLQLLMPGQLPDAAPRSRRIQALRATLRQASTSDARPFAEPAWQRPLEEQQRHAVRSEQQALSHDLLRLLAPGPDNLALRFRPLLQVAIDLGDAAGQWRALARMQGSLRRSASGPSQADPAVLQRRAIALDCLARLVRGLWCLRQGREARPADNPRGVELSTWPLLQALQRAQALSQQLRAEPAGDAHARWDQWRTQSEAELRRVARNALATLQRTTPTRSAPAGHPERVRANQAREVRMLTALLSLADTALSLSARLSAPGDAPSAAEPAHLVRLVRDAQALQPAAATTAFEHASERLRRWSAVDLAVRQAAERVVPLLSPAVAVQHLVATLGAERKASEQALSATWSAAGTALHASIAAALDGALQAAGTSASTPDALAPLGTVVAQLRLLTRAAGEPALTEVVGAHESATATRLAHALEHVLAARGTQAPERYATLTEAISLLGPSRSAASGALQAVAASALEQLSAAREQLLTGVRNAIQAVARAETIRLTPVKLASASVAIELLDDLARWNLPRHTAVDRPPPPHTSLFAAMRDQISEAALARRELQRISATPFPEPIRNAGEIAARLLERDELSLRTRLGILPPLQQLQSALQEQPAARHPALIRAQAQALRRDTRSVGEAQASLALLRQQAQAPALSETLEAVHVDLVRNESLVERTLLTLEALALFADAEREIERLEPQARTMEPRALDHRLTNVLRPYRQAEDLLLPALARIQATVTASSEASNGRGLAVDNLTAVSGTSVGGLLLRAQHAPELHRHRLLLQAYTDNDAAAAQTPAALALRIAALKELQQAILRANTRLTTLMREGFAEPIVQSLLRLGLDNLRAAGTLIGQVSDAARRQAAAEAAGSAASPQNPTPASEPTRTTTRGPGRRRR